MPGGQYDHERPFTGLVVNINAYTLGHRDSKDFILCILIPIGDFVGGEICLYEPGLVFPVTNGDFFAFNSPRATHFNLPYTGQRASLVLESDIEGLKWLKDWNGWEGNAYAPK